MGKHETEATAAAGRDEKIQNRLEDLNSSLTKITNFSLTLEEDQWVDFVRCPESLGGAQHSRPEYLDPLSSDLNILTEVFNAEQNPLADYGLIQA